MATEVKEQKIVINGVDLTYKIAGNGQPLVLIHTHHPYAKYFLENLPKEAQYQVLTINTPGYYSDKQAKPVETIDQFTNLLSQLFDKLNFKKVDLMGECLGSVIALKFAAHYPQKVRKLVLVSLPLRVFNFEVKKSLGPILASLHKNYLLGRVGKLLILLNIWRSISDFLGGYQGLWDVVQQETLLVSRFNFDQRVFFGVLSDLLKTDIKKVFRQLKSETLLVIGDKDKVTRKKEIEKICREKKNCSWALILKANHALVVKNTSQLHQIVLKFLLN